MTHLIFEDSQVFGGAAAGGVLGEVLGEVLRSMMGTVGAYVVGATVLLITLVLRSPVSVGGISAMIVGGLRRVQAKLVTSFETIWEAWIEARDLERAEQEEYEREFGPRIAGIEDESLHDDEDLENAVISVGDESEPSAQEQAELLAAVELLEQEVELDEPEVTPVTKPKRRRSPKKDEPTIVAPVQKPVAKKGKKKGTTILKHGAAPFELPSPTLLAEPPPNVIQVDAAQLRQNALRLVEKLEAYGVRGRVDEIHPGPVVTMYEFEPQSGTKLSKIANLADDLAMALAAQKVRIVAPIPGKARVGFELPNSDRQTVYLREIIEDERWQRHKAALPVALGQDIAGNPVYGDLSKMPHLLVAGATGQGKSVGINVMLASLLTRKTPDEVRLLMIDPKVVELQVFDGIPHMLLPVVTDMKKAALALRWAVDEMERRYQLFADAGSRNILGFNTRVDRVLDGSLELEKFNQRKCTDDAELKAPEKLPHIVVVVDEFADLMMVAAKDVEACVARLAQKARAAGIHVVLATQRPSVDVITGMIKANFPARMAFKVSQREDSKTILGRNGAENLLGRGDLLMLPPGSSDLKRVHGAFIDEDEVRAVCDFLREQATPIYDDEILKPREDDSNGSGKKSDDPLYDRAVQCVAEAGYCSISHVQRKLSVGYNKAAKLVDRMEAAGVVGPPAGKAGGRRQVLIQPH